MCLDEPEVGVCTAGDLRKEVGCARITQLACSKAPEVSARWTVRLLADHPGGRDVFIGEDGRRTAKEFAACLERKNEKPGTINWQFTNGKARIKLKPLYPSS